MEDYVLFSCVGKTDPVKGLRDGPMLHIARWFKPRKIYIVLSKEMERLHGADDRYNKSIRKLCHDFGITIETEYIHTGIEDVSEFDAFDTLFDEIMARIVRENPDSTILLNVSSGSLQMNMKLCFIATDRQYRTLPVQVKNYTRKADTERGTTHPSYDVDLEIELNEDHTTYAHENRTSVPAFAAMNKLLIRRQIERLLSSYDYIAAKSIADSYQHNVTSEVKTLIQHCIHRQALEHKLAKQTIAPLALPFDAYPVKNSGCAQLCEYLALLQCYQRTGRITDFVLRLNPFVIRLQWAYLYANHGFDYTAVDDGSKERRVLRCKISAYDRGLLSHIDRCFSRGFKDGSFWTIRLLNHIIDYYEPTKGASRTLFGTLQVVNDKRNDAAHELANVSEQDVIDAAGMGSLQVIDDLKRVIYDIYGNVCKFDAFAIYDTLNRFIVDALS